MNKIFKYIFMDVSQLKLYVDRYTRGHDYFDAMVLVVDKKLRQIYDY